ncbi:MAG TPA: glycosyltransferase family 87 protein [Chthoniobacterales bacterium]|nr:glycosyltransferase family 87 protein [Chthoniobacterales bacterium]
MVVLAVCAARAIYKPEDGDFKLHWEFGRRFLAGEFLYTGGHHLPYPPFWAMAHAPVALVPLPIGKALLFPIGVAALLALLSILRRLGAPAFRLSATEAFWAAAFALLLASRYVIRDMAEVGVNTALVLLTWSAIYLWRQERDALAAMSLGAAVALKCTPAIFAAFFLWKRQWRMAAFTAFAAFCFTFAPVVWQGPPQHAAHMRTWLTNAWRLGGGDPAAAMMESKLVRNMSLGATVASYLPQWPSTVRSGLVKLSLVATVGAVMWWSRHAPRSRHDPRVLWEFSAVSIVMLLVSPITWGQHCVALLPPAYFIGALFATRRQLPRWMWTLLGLYIFFVLALSRDLLGKDLALRLASYHVETVAILGLLAVVLGARRWHTSARKALA